MDRLTIEFSMYDQTYLTIILADICALGPLEGLVPELQYLLTTWVVLVTPTLTSLTHTSPAF